MQVKKILLSMFTGIFLNMSCINANAMYSNVRLTKEFLNIKRVNLDSYSDKEKENGESESKKLLMA